MGDERISIRAHYERFPASVKGAFVLRAADGQPHQVRLEGARVAEIAGAGGCSIDLAPATLDVAPNLDLFVPFEFATTDLGPGWFELVCDVAVDGVAGKEHPGERFPVAWPRASTRRGIVNIGRAVAAGDGKVRLEQLECTSDSVRVTYTADHHASIALTADGMKVGLIGEAFDEETRTGTVTGYPALKNHARMGIDVKGSSGPVEVKLP
jgi:hypothetical protein